MSLVLAHIQNLISRFLLTECITEKYPQFINTLMITTSAKNKCPNYTV